MTVLSDKTLHRLAAAGLVQPYSPGLVNPASIDLRLGNAWIVMDDKSRHTNYWNHLVLYPKSLRIDLHNWIANGRLGEYYGMKVRPTLVLATTLENVSIPTDMWARLALKTTPCREGLGHPVADWIDPGFCGHLTLMLHAFSPIKLYQGMRVCQLIVGELDWECEVPYSEIGHYQGQKGPTPSWREQYVYTDVNSQ